jgi:hypothetical protein
MTNDLEGRLAAAEARVDMYRQEINAYEYDFRLLIELFKMLEKEVYVDPEGIVVRNNDRFNQTFMEIRDQIFRAELLVGRPEKGKP